MCVFLCLSSHSQRLSITGKPAQSLSPPSPPPTPLTRIRRIGRVEALEKLGNASVLEDLRFGPATPVDRFALVAHLVRLPYLEAALLAELVVHHHTVLVLGGARIAQPPHLVPRTIELGRAKEDKATQYYSRVRMAPNCCALLPTYLILFKVIILLKRHAGEGEQSSLTSIDGTPQVRHRNHPTRERFHPGCALFTFSKFGN